jgi:quinol monooxygenase YgiN
MSVAMVARLRVRPRQTAALVREFERLFASWQARQLGHQNAQLFQGITHPDYVIYVGEWETREAAATAVQSPAVEQALNPLLTVPARFDHFQRLLYTEFMARRAQAVSCAFVTGTDATADAVRDCPRTATKEVLEASPGFVLQLLYQDVDVAWRLFCVPGLGLCPLAPGGESAAVRLHGSPGATWGGRGGVPGRGTGGVPLTDAIEPRARPRSSHLGALAMRARHGIIATRASDKNRKRRTR